MLEEADLLVNTTSLGMAGKAPLEIDLSPLPKTAIVTDAVYAPLETDLLRSAKARGNQTVDALACCCIRPSRLSSAGSGFGRKWTTPCATSYSQTLE